MGVLKKASAKRSKNKRGQLQTQETILVVFIFIILIVFGLVFFYRVQSSSIAQEFNEFQKDKLSVDFITLGDLPEFSCSKAGIKESCIDTAKLIAFSSLYNSTRQYKDYYFERFGYKNITIYQIYPKNTKNSNKCSSSKLEDCGVWEVYVKKPSKNLGKRVYDTPVSLYNPENDQYTIGIMVVEAYGE